MAKECNGFRVYTNQVVGADNAGENIRAIGDKVFL